MKVEKGSFYVVATPIGNLADITYRAVEVLKNSDLIICENPVNSSKLFKEYGISKPLSRLYHSMQEKDYLPFLQKLNNNEVISLVSDAGTPGISDPGSPLIRYLRKNHKNIIPVPGASTLTSILSISGFQTNPTIFLGFLSEKKNKKKDQLEKLKDFQGLIVMFESIYKLDQTLEFIKEIYSQSELLIGRELTKNFEEIIWLPEISEMKTDNISRKGEFVILINNLQKKISKEKLRFTDK